MVAILGSLLLTADLVEALVDSLRLVISLVVLFARTALQFCGGVLELSAALVLRALELLDVAVASVALVSSTTATACSWVAGCFSSLASVLVAGYGIACDLLSYLAMDIEAIYRGAVLLIRGGLIILYSALDLVVFCLSSFYSLARAAIDTLSRILSSSGGERQGRISPPVVNIHIAVLTVAALAILTLCINHRELVIQGWRVVRDLVTGCWRLARECFEGSRQLLQSGEGDRHLQQRDRGGGSQNGGRGLQLESGRAGSGRPQQRNSVRHRGNFSPTSNFGYDARQTSSPLPREPSPDNPQREGFPPASPSPRSVSGEEREESRRCIVCMEQEKKVLLRPCCHYCVCEDCTVRLGGVCPVCRNVIKSAEVIHVYYD
jgi:hypothetical protein